METTPPDFRKTILDLVKSRYEKFESKNRWRVCVHEAGHCVVQQLVGGSVEYAEVFDRGGQYPGAPIGWKGWTRFIADPCETVETTFTSTVAGGVAEVAVLGGESRGVASDAESLRKICDAAGMSADQRIDLTNCALTGAKKIIDASLGAVNSVAEVLRTTGRIEGPQIAAIIADEREKQEKKIADEARAKSEEIARNALSSAKRSQKPS